MKLIKLKEDFSNEENKGNTKVSYSTNEKIYIIPEGKYFVMGDNRNHSTDSRSFFSINCTSTDRDNYISKVSIIGKVIK